MQWKLAHRNGEDSGPTEHVTLEADTSGKALEILRAQLPQGHQILYVMRGEDADLD